MLQWPEGMPLREFKEQLRLVAREVMPAFTGATARGWQDSVTPRSLASPVGEARGKMP